VDDQSRFFLTIRVFGIPWHSRDMPENRIKARNLPNPLDLQKADSGGNGTIRWHGRRHVNVAEGML
jgi:hypothetical protein